MGQFIYFFRSSSTFCPPARTDNKKLVPDCVGHAKNASSQGIGLNEQKREQQKV